MKPTQYKPLAQRKAPKADREMAVLLGCIEQYIKTGKPIGSQTLQEEGFEHMSSATIRNYLSKMEEEGYVEQPHASGGRVPTQKGFRLYVDSLQGHGSIEKEQERALQDLFSTSSKEVASQLHKGADLLSDLSQCAVILSSPRFDQDFLQDVKLVRIDASRLLAILLTDFGLIRTETMYLEKDVPPYFLPTFEEYFLWRINKGTKPFFEEEKDRKLAQRLYNEIMVRHVVGYANFPNEELLRSGLANLLSYPEFNDATSLANSLSLLEDLVPLRKLLREAMQKGSCITWIGDELCPYVPEGSNCSLLAIPYRLHQSVVGAVALLGPTRLPYRNLLGLLEVFAQKMSESLTQSLYKYKMTFRQPPEQTHLLERKE